MDVVLLVSIILGTYDNPSNEQLQVSDLNNDNNVNIADIVILVSIILN